MPKAALMSPVSAVTVICTGSSTSLVVSTPFALTDAYCASSESMRHVIALLEVAAGSTCAVSWTDLSSGIEYGPVILTSFEMAVTVTAHF